MDRKIISMCILLAVIATTSHASNNGKYWYNWGIETHVFETLPEAEASLRSHAAPANRFTRVNHEVDNGREVFYYEVPRRVDPVDMVTLYETSIGSPSCKLRDFFCWTEQEAVERILEYARNAWGMCVLNHDIEGDWGNGGYSRGGRPHPDERAPGFYFVQQGKQLHFFTQRKSGEHCYGSELEYYRSMYRIDFYYCPDGYEGKIAADHTDGWCGSNLSQKVYGPVSSSCDEEIGNPCGILAGTKTESEADIVTDDLEFTRTYQSSQKN